jgi:hypothetical protein
MAAQDPEATVAIQHPGVTRGQPAVSPYGGGVGAALVVAVHHPGTGHQDLSVVRDPDIGAGKRPANGAGVVVTGQIHTHGPAGLGESVAVEDDHTGELEELGEVALERGTARDHET